MKRGLKTDSVDTGFRMVNGSNLRREQKCNLNTDFSSAAKATAEPMSGHM